MNQKQDRNQVKLWANPRLYVATFTLVLVVDGIIAALRGSHIADSVSEPTAAEPDPRCAIVDGGQEHYPVECKALFAHSMDAVWGVITDYDRFSEIFDSVIWEFLVTEQERKDEEAVHLQGKVQSILGTWPIDVVLQEKIESERRTISWDAPAGRIQTNRGSWTLTPGPDGTTITTYSLDVTVDPIPGFLVRNILLDQIAAMLEMVGEQLDNGGQGT